MIHTISKSSKNNCVGTKLTSYSHETNIYKANHHMYATSYQISQQKVGRLLDV